MIRLLFVLSVLTISGQTSQLFSQVDTIFGCENFPDPTAYSYCTVCSTNPLFGTSYGFLPGPQQGWCGTIENDQYIGIHASALGTVSMDVEVFNCQVGTGLQFGVYDINNMLVGACLGQVTPAGSQVLSADGLTPGELYFLRIDGYAGDFCEFLITFFGGLNHSIHYTSTDSSAGLTYYNYCDPGLYIHPDSLRAGNCTYARTWQVEPSGAGSVSTSSGSSGTPSLVEVEWTGSSASRAFLVADYELVSQDSGMACSPLARDTVISHFQDLHDYQRFDSDGYWPCNQSRFVDTLSANFNSWERAINLLEVGDQQYVISGAGYGDRFFVYRLTQGAQVWTGEIDPQHWTDTLSIDFDLGPATLILSSRNSNTTEFAIERLEPTGICAASSASDTLYVCGEGTLEFESCMGYSLDDPFFWEVFDSVTYTIEAPGVPRDNGLLSEGNGNQLSLPLVLFLGAQPGLFYQGAFLTATFHPQPSFSTCIDSAALEINYQLLPGSTDTLILPVAVGVDEADIFGSYVAGMLNVDRAGVYYMLYASGPDQCTLLQQEVVLNATDLGTISVCPGDCALAAGGDTLSCASGPFATMTSDGPFVGEVEFSTDSPLSVSTTIVCESISSTYMVHLTFTGSQPPYYFSNGDSIFSNSAEFGPYAFADSFAITITGSGACRDSIVIEGTSNCVSSLRNPGDLASLGIEVIRSGKSLIVRQLGFEPVDIWIYDVSGRLVESASGQQGYNLDLNHIPAGVLTLVAQVGNRRGSQKFYTF